jgi:phosphate transport system protein
MPRTKLDQDLQELRGDALRIGNLVVEALERVLPMLKNANMPMCSTIVEADGRLDLICRGVRKHTFDVLTLQQPLGHCDLRFLTSMLAMIGDLERVGDGVKGIAQLLGYICPHAVSVDGVSADLPAVAECGRYDNPSEPEQAILHQCHALGNAVVHFLRETMNAFQHSDVHAARLLWQDDDLIDVRYHEVRHEIMSLLAGRRALDVGRYDDFVFQRLTYYLWIAHKLERTADHCTNICERTVYMLEGEMNMEPLNFL